MRTFIGRAIRNILGIDDTELPNGQLKYIKDMSQKYMHLKINEENLIYFLETLKEKHGLEEISLFRKGTAIFSSEQEELSKATDFYELFNKTRHMIDKKLMMIKDKLWVTIFEKENFVFVVKCHVKLSEIELNAITSDVIKNLDKVLLEEKNVLENPYISIGTHVN